MPPQLVYFFIFLKEGREVVLSDGKDLVETRFKPNDPHLQWVCWEDFTRAISWSRAVYKDQKNRKKRSLFLLMLLSLELTSSSHQNQNGLKATVKFVMQIKRKG